VVKMLKQFWDKMHSLDEMLKKVVLPFIHFLIEKHY
jgi:hypothetical protein